MGYSTTSEHPAQHVYGANFGDIHETTTVPERYHSFNPLGVQKDAGFSRFTPTPTSLRKLSLTAIGIYFQIAAENKREGLSINRLKTSYKHDDSAAVDAFISQLIENGYVRVENRDADAFLFVNRLENEEVAR